MDDFVLFSKIPHNRKLFWTFQMVKKMLIKFYTSFALWQAILKQFLRILTYSELFLIILIFSEQFRTFQTMSNVLDYV